MKKIKNIKAVNSFCVLLNTGVENSWKTKRTLNIKINAKHTMSHFFTVGLFISLFITNFLRTSCLFIYPELNQSESIMSTLQNDILQGWVQLP